MNYYKITLPEKTYVSRGKCASLVMYHFYEEFSFDGADTDGANDYFSIEPMGIGMTVKGVDAMKALDDAALEYAMKMVEIKKDLINEYKEDANTYIEEEYGQLADMTFTLEADSEKLDEHYMKDGGLWVKLADGRNMPYEQYERERKLYEALLWD